MNFRNKSFLMKFLREWSFISRSPAATFSLLMRLIYASAAQLFFPLWAWWMGIKTRVEAGNLKNLFVPRLIWKEPNPFFFFFSSLFFVTGHDGESGIIHWPIVLIGSLILLIDGFFFFSIVVKQKVSLFMCVHHKFGIMSKRQSKRKWEFMEVII